MNLDIDIEIMNSQYRKKEEKPLITSLKLSTVQNM
jgi:hypothetical protein